MSNLIIGVTGVMGAGKSTVCKMMQDLGVIWLDYEGILSELYKTDNAGWRKVKDYFGEEYLLKDGVNLERLQKKVLNDPHKMAIVNRLMNPLVANEMSKKIVQQSTGEHKMFSIESLNFGGEQLRKMSDVIVVVSAEEEMIYERLKTGPLSRKELSKFVMIQPPEQVREDYALSNSSDQATLKGVVADLMGKIARERV
jgi:dephospho-CoA kinase